MSKRRILSTEAARKSHDAIIIGAGASGGWAAKRLTESGLRVLLLDAGPDRSNSATIGRIRAAAEGSFTRQPVQRRCSVFSPGTREFFVDDMDNPYSTAEGRPFDWIRCRGFGGRTVVWNRIALRLSNRQLKAPSRDGVDVRWPLSYSDLAPHYDQIERFYGLTGISERHPDIPDGRFSGRRILSASELRFKSTVEGLWPNRLVTAARQIGFAVPTSKERDPVAGLLFSTAVDAIRDAVKTGCLDPRPDAVVARIEVDRAGGRASGVTFIDRRTKETHRANARAVLLCASTLESTRILLNSATPRRPEGLGNSSGALGRYLMDHVSGVHIEGRRKSTPEKSGAGHHLYMPNIDGKNFAAVVKVGYPWPAKRGWTGGRIDFFGEMLPRAENRVTLRRDVKDAWGLPTLHIDCAYTEHEHRMTGEQKVLGRELLAGAGYESLSSNLSPGVPGSAHHEMGTARMGSDRRTSVVDRDGRCWDVPNLFLGDGAVFPGSGFQNPTLTMMAVASRACDRIIAETRKQAQTA